MFDNFPYTNFHELNLDWIIKIAKDFLDQYTHIQDIISDGEQSLSDLTEQGLADLDQKATDLTALLDEWYNTHSQDIADQLAQALSDLNDWYTTHSTDISNELNSAISSFNAAATQKGEQVIQSIPDDYTAITEQIDNVENLLILSNRNAQYALDLSYYTITDTMINGAGTGTSSLSGYNTTP